MKWTVGTKIGTGFAIALTVFAIVGGVSYRGTTRLAETADWVTHSHKVLENLDTLLLGMTVAESSQRGFIITGDDAYLEPYQASLVSANSALKDIRILTKDSVEQQRRADALESQVARRVACLDEGKSLRHSNDPEVAYQFIRSGKGKKEMDEIRKSMNDMRDEEVALLNKRAQQAQATVDTSKSTIVTGTLVAFVCSAFAGFVITRGISRRLGAITAAARRIAEGDLSDMPLHAGSGDEVAELATAFVSMRSGLKEMAISVRQATENVSSNAAEILASTRQQAAASEEQAATVQEITSTIEEINQSGVQISERAKQVSASIEATAAISSQGLKATRDANQTMEVIRGQVEEVAENVVSLCERTQTIGEIIATVNEIAEQSNLLALNASIEAVSAGTQGGRFSVVAHEMKSLADRAKDCTVQVRTILGEVQKGINSSVMLTEGAVKRVESGKQQAGATESTIRDMTDVTERCIQAFQQILGGANQQQIGVSQVTQGMQDIRQAVTQSAAGTSQLERSAANLNALSQQLRTVVSKYGV